MKRSLTQKPVKKNRMTQAVMMVVRMTQAVVMVVRMTQAVMMVVRMTQETPEVMTVLTLEILAQRPKLKLKLKLGETEVETKLKPKLRRNPKLTKAHWTLPESQTTLPMPIPTLSVADDFTGDVEIEVGRSQ